jgi:CRISPR-associated protein Cas2
LFVLIAYDVNAKRTSRYRKLLVKYLGHEQFSVFFGDITKSTLEKMRRELNKLITDGDRVLELIAENRNNVDIVVSGKYGHIEGIPRREEDDRHKSDSGIL